MKSEKEIRDRISEMWQYLKRTGVNGQPVNDCCFFRQIEALKWILEDSE